MEDYYAGADGARRLMKQLDQLFQHIVDIVEPAESMHCAITIRLDSGEQVELDKTYHQTEQSAGTRTAAR